MPPLAAGPLCTAELPGPHPPGAVPGCRSLPRPTVSSASCLLLPALYALQNFLALIPLALFLGEVTEDLAVRFGDIIGGLLNATFGNVVEL